MQSSHQGQTDPQLEVEVPSKMGQTLLAAEVVMVSQTANMNFT
jgi:hypothetical protein